MTKVQRVEAEGDTPVAPFRPVSLPLHCALMGNLFFVQQSKRLFGPNNIAPTGFKAVIGQMAALSRNL